MKLPLHEFLFVKATAPFFVYIMSRVQIRACTKICIRRMYIIEPLGEMLLLAHRVEVSLFDFCNKLLFVLNRGDI